MGDDDATTQSGPGIRPLTIAAVAVVLALILGPALSSLRVEDAASSTTAARPFSERPPFGEPLRGKLAYLGRDRIFTLVDLETGHIEGSKGIPAERRPAAASTTRAFLGSVPAGRADGNWDRYRSLPWEAAVYRDDAMGVSVAYSPQLDVVAAAMDPLPEGGRGLVLADAAGQRVVARSSGKWAFVIWVGDGVLVRELSGDRVNWWRVDGATGLVEQLALPAGLRPIAGSAEAVVGELEGAGVIVNLEDGTATQLAGPVSWAAAWSPDGAMVATVAGAAPALYAYHADGSLAWSMPLEEPVTMFRGGLAWSPDGSFLAVAAGDGIEAYRADGSPIGELSATLPTPQTAPGAAFLTVVAP